MSASLVPSWPPKCEATNNGVSLLMGLDNNRLGELIHRIVEAVHPLRIILFGSAVRNQAGPDSDVDVLVVMPDGAPRREIVKHLHTRLFGFDLPVDILVATPKDLGRHCENIGLIYRTILREGKVIYDV